MSFSDIGAHIFRTILMYFIVYGAIRVMGKREIGKLSMFDLVVSIMLAEIAAFVIEDTDKPLSHGIVPMVTVLVVQIGMAFLSLKSRRLRLMIDGKPTVLISKGTLHRDEMRKQRYNLDDLLLQLREQNIDSIGEVEFAILETTGKLTVIPMNNSSSGQGNSSSQNNMKKPRQDKIDGFQNIKYEGLPLPLIMDGKVQDQNLELIQKTRFWLKNQIQQKGVLDFKDVFICSIDHNGKVFVSLKDDKK
ncbi:YetF domain-containing protein [Paenibacillus illinoisensis]|uniref:YetF domain-containing protein n=1 Tax=Paenibacillus illinoisensis TaxID=59845 RepID=A0ABW8HWA8_9BACL